MISPLYIKPSFSHGFQFGQAVTDGSSTVTYDPVARPAVSNLIQIYSVMEDIPIPVSRGEGGCLDVHLR